MEENIINIARLTVDVQGATDDIVATRKEIFELQKANIELRKNIQNGTGDVDAQTKLFVEQEQKLKQLQASYKEQSTALNEYTFSNVKNSKALTENAKSIQQAQQQNKELTATRNQLDSTTIDGAKAIELINQKLDQNNKFINTNSSELEKQKNNVGNYAGALEGVDGILQKFGINGQQARNVISGFSSTVSKGANDIADFTNSTVNAGAKLIGFKTSAQLAAESTNDIARESQLAGVASNQLATSQFVSSAATNVATLSLRGFAIALAATGIGAIVVIIGILISSLSKLDGPMDAIEQATAGIGGAFSKAIDIIANFILSISSVKDGLAKVGAFFANPIASIKTFTKEVGKAYDQAAALKGLEQNLGDLREVYDVRNKQLQSEIDLNNVRLKSKKLTSAQEVQIERENAKAFKEISDNKKEVSKKDLDIAFTNAIQTSEKLSAIDKEKLRQDLKNGSIKVAQDLKNNDIIEEAAYEKLLKTVGNKAEINQSLAEQEERNQNKLEKARDRIEAQEQKRLEKKQKDFDESIKRSQNEIDIIKLNAKENDTTAEQKMATAQKVFNLENDLAKKSLTGSDEQKKLIEIRQNLSSEILKISEQQITSEIDLQKKLISEKKSISESEKNDLLANAEFLRKTETEKINNLLISEVEKNNAKIEIEKGFNESKILINKGFEDSEKIRKEELAALDILDFELKILTLEERGYAENELKRQILEAEHIERLRMIGLQVDAEGKLTAKGKKEVEIENKKYQKATKSIDEQVMQTKRNANFKMVQDSIGALQAIFGESKALSVASALINTYQGITAGVKLGYPLAIPAVALAAATGFAAVKNILKTDKGSSGGATSDTGTSSPAAQTFENPAVTQTLATLQQVPAVNGQNQPQTVLVLETLQEVTNQQQIKINS